MRTDPASGKFQSRLEAAKTEGVAGREELLHRLARMPMDKVVNLPASSLAILGPHGLARLAAMREDLAGVARRPVVQAAKPKPQVSGKAGSVAKARPIRSTLIMVLSIIAVGLLADLAGPVLAPALFDPGVRPPETSRWPACRRLDAHVDGCVYTSGSGALSLQRVATLTGVPAGQLLSANRHLDAPPDAALPKHSPIVIWRGRLRLTGAPQ